MTILEFMSDSPWLSFFLALILANLLQWCICLPFRAINIFKNGWPPSYLDADGDYKTKERKQ